MKKVLLSLFFLITLSFCASAKVGDVAGDIYSTDILTYVDGHIIPSYSINGEMLIVAEDLVYYGFNTYYDDTVRTLFVNYVAKEPLGIKEVKQGEVGKTDGKYYESDIKVVLNGKEISSYSLNGRMAIKAEETGKLNEEGRYYEYGFSDNLMKCVWDEEERKLNLYTHLWVFNDVEKFKEEYKEKDDFLWFYDKEIKLSGASLLIGGQSGTPHGTYFDYQYITDDGRCVLNLNNVFMAYNFSDIWGHIKIENVRAYNDKIMFEGTKNDGSTGTYILNPATSELKTLN